jgi:hypothetical protein
VIPATTKAAPEGVYLLADHLDAALAAAEDLLALRLEPAADVPEGTAPEEALRDFVARLRQLEAALLLHLLQARRHAAEITVADAAVRSVLRLVAASTGGLLELVDGYGDTLESFDTGGDTLQALRRRGLIVADAAGVTPFETVTIGDGYRIGGVVEAGGLLDVVAGALDLLDQRFDLYGDGAAGEAEPAGAEAAEATPAVDAAVADDAARDEAADATPMTPGSLAAALAELRQSS